MYYLGIDLGSSSVKIALVRKEQGEALGVIHEPRQEMSITSRNKGWAEQSPESWWGHTCTGIKRILSDFSVPAEDIKGIGISYQMHGLVLLDKDGNLLRDAIIWCDSRAVADGKELAGLLGKEYCRDILLNEPGNFTASKLAWVRRNEPELFSKVAHALWPGDYLVWRFTGTLSTTPTALSEGIYWDFVNEKPANRVLEAIGADPAMLPSWMPSIGHQGSLNSKGAEESGLKAGTPILYRAGDQPNNAMSLQVMEPGETAATGGTSGVIYSVTDTANARELSRINSFLHVNHRPNKQTRIGKLLCINGCGIQYRWVRDQFQLGSYEEMNALASLAPFGSDGLRMFPFGNGAERMLDNVNVGARISGLDFNRHRSEHYCRAALEGIAFAFMYGFEILKQEGVDPSVIRTGNDNLFRSEVFARCVSDVLGIPIEVFSTTGAAGAARACAMSLGHFDDYREQLSSERIRLFEPEDRPSPICGIYREWKTELEKQLEY